MNKQILYTTATLLTIGTGFSGNNYFTDQINKYYFDQNQLFETRTLSDQNQFDYFKYTFKNLADELFSLSRNFNLEESKSYNAFIDEFFV